MDKVKIGIIGIGNMGSGHCGTLLKGTIENAELAAVADVKENRRKWAAENLPEGTLVREGDSLRIPESHWLRSDAIIRELLFG